MVQGSVETATVVITGVIGSTGMRSRVGEGPSECPPLSLPPPVF
jgi:hypothetical protein